MTVINWHNTIDGLAADLANAREWPVAIVRDMLRQRHNDGTGIAALTAIASEVSQRRDLNVPKVLLSHVPSQLGNGPGSSRAASPRSWRCTTCGKRCTPLSSCDCNACEHGEPRGADYCPFCRNGATPR